jgi:energy-coupling factor transport system ATP-binding protein
MIRFDHVSFGYDAACSHIHDISFSIQKGEFIAIIGENGAGKTTVSKLMNGLLKPSSGSVRILGMDTAETKLSRLARHIGFLFQNPDRQLCQNTVRREIRFGLDLVRDDMAGNAARVEQVLAEFGFEGCEDPFTLSRGERQRVALPL